MKTEIEHSLEEQSCPDQKTDEGVRMKMKKAVLILELLVGEAIALLLAGIVAPSYFRSYLAAGHALTMGSLHTLTVAGMTFKYKLMDLGFAVLGALCGAAIALALESPAAVARARRIVRAPRGVCLRRVSSPKAGGEAAPATGVVASLRAVVTWAATRLGARLATDCADRQQGCRFTSGRDEGTLPGSKVLFVDRGRPQSTTTA